MDNALLRLGFHFILDVSNRLVIHGSWYLNVVCTMFDADRIPNMTEFESRRSARNSVDSFSKALYVTGRNAGNRNSAVLGSVHRVL